MSRLDQLNEMLVSEPDDKFLNYALAMELDKAGRHDESLARFNKVIGGPHPYVPAFFMAAQMLNRLGRFDEARDFLKRGIPEANRQGNAHAAGEMSEYLEMIGED
jgi:tetratricopeptide (TPR) repeat protein